MPTLRALRLLQNIEDKTLNSAQLETLLSGSLSKQSDLPLLCHSSTAKTRILATETFPTIAGSASAVVGLAAFTTSATAVAANLAAMTTIVSSASANAAFAASTPGATAGLASRDIYKATVGVQTQASGRQTPWATAWRFATLKAISQTLSVAGVAVNPTTGAMTASTTSTSYLSSKDGGFTWTAATGGVAIPVNSAHYWPYGASYAINTPVAASAASAYSSGAHWTQVNGNPVNAAGYSKVAYISGYYVAVGKSAAANVAYYTGSAAGIFTAATLPASVQWYDVAASSTRAIAISTNTVNTAYTTNGTTWSAGTALPSISSWYAIDSGNGLDDGKFMVANATTNTVAFSSNNGVAWSTITIPGFEGSTNVCYHSAARAWVVFGSSKIAISTNDGTSWTVFAAAYMGSGYAGSGGPYMIAGSGVNAYPAF